MLRGSGELREVCHRHIGDPHQVTSDGKFSWLEVECLGACVNAPMAQINQDYYEDLTPASFEKILYEMAAGRTPKPGPQIDRQLSAPIGQWTTLNDPPTYEDKTGKSDAVQATSSSEMPTAPATGWRPTNAVGDKLQE